jgi:hypothetical protein
MHIISVFFIRRVPGQGPEQRQSNKTVLYLLIVIIMLIIYSIIKLLIKRRTIPAETRNKTLSSVICVDKSVLKCACNCQLH